MANQITAETGETRSSGTAPPDLTMAGQKGNTMHLVEVRNVFTGEVVDRILFEDVSRAFEYAMNMNDTKRHTPLRYVFIN